MVEHSLREMFGLAEAGVAATGPSIASGAATDHRVGASEQAAEERPATVPFTGRCANSTPWTRTREARTVSPAPTGSGTSTQARCSPASTATRFAPMQQALSSKDVMIEYIQHTGSAAFARPPGTRPEGYWGSSLFE